MQENQIGPGKTVGIGVDTRTNPLQRRAFFTTSKIFYHNSSLRR